MTIIQDKNQILEFSRKRIDTLALWIVNCFSLFAQDNIHTTKETQIFQSAHYYDAHSGIYILFDIIIYSLLYFIWYLFIISYY